MNFAERAFRYLFRKKGKAIILFWVLLITETMILSTVTILRASEVARIELLGKSKAKLLIEREKAEELFTDDEYKKLEKLENVKAVNRVAEVQLYPMDFKIITKSESVDADNQKLRMKEILSISMLYSKSKMQGSTIKLKSLYRKRI